MTDQKSDLLSRALGMERRARERAGKSPTPPSDSVPIPVLPPGEQLLLLPFCEEKFMAVPNAILRSSLFGAIRKGKRPQHFGTLMASVEGVTIKHTGPALDQADLDVWEHALALARQNGSSNVITFSSRAFLRALDRCQGKSDRTWLANAFLRLTASVVEINVNRVAYTGNMIHEGIRDDKTGQYTLKLNPNIAGLFTPDGWSKVEWEQRMKLKGTPLAQWLHGFYSTHAAPYPYRIETIHRLCGSETQDLKHFQELLKDALEKIKPVAKWNYMIKNGLLHVVKKPTTPSQARHFVRKVTGG